MWIYPESFIQGSIVKSWFLNRMIMVRYTCKLNCTRIALSSIELFMRLQGSYRHKDTKQKGILKKMYLHCYARNGKANPKMNSQNNFFVRYTPYTVKFDLKPL